MATNENSTGSVLLAFAVGALAGAAVALLFAPASGEETRRKLGEKARDGRDTLASAAQQAREAFEKARKESV